MKQTALIGAIFAVALVAYILDARTPEISAPEARFRISALDELQGLHLEGKKQFEGDAVLGSRIEREVRDLLRIHQRETPCMIEDYEFRDASGLFTVQLLDLEGKPARITVYGGPEPPAPMGELIRMSFPAARFVAKP